MRPLQRGVDDLVLAHAGHPAERFRDDGSGKMVVVASQIFDGDLRIRESGFDQGFDFAGGHSHWSGLLLQANQAGKNPSWASRNCAAMIWRCCRGVSNSCPLRWPICGCRDAGSLGGGQNCFNVSCFHGRAYSGPGPRRTRIHAPGLSAVSRMPGIARPAPFRPGRPAARHRRHRGRRPLVPLRICARTKSPFLRSAARSTAGGAPVFLPENFAQPERSARARLWFRRSGPGPARVSAP